MIFTALKELFEDIIVEPVKDIVVEPTKEIIIEPAKEIAKDIWEVLK